MKTLEEVKAHFKNVGYRHQDMPRIEGFLFGKGLFEGDEFEIEFMCGERDFYDFKDWFNGEEKTKTPIDWSEFGFGDYIHVDKETNAIVLGDIFENKFVGTNGNIVHLFELTNESRPCNEEEIESINNSLSNNGVLFCADESLFVPHEVCQKCKVEAKNLVEHVRGNLNELCKTVDAMSDDDPFKPFALGMKEALEKMAEEVIGRENQKNESEELDQLEIDAKNAVENIIASLHANELDPHEKELVLGTLEALVVLGNEYE